MIADLVGMVMLLLLFGVFSLLIAPVVLVLLWLNRKLFADYRQNGQFERPQKPC